MRILFVLAITIPLMSFAESKINAEDSMECESNNQYQAEIVECLLAKQGNTKKPLNLAYGKLAEKLSDNEIILSELEQIQKKWVELRNQQCKLEADLTDRDADKYLIEQSCLNYMNKQRTDYFNSIDL